MTNLTVDTKLEEPLSVVLFTSCFISYYDRLDEHSTVDVPVAERRKMETVVLRSKYEKYANQIAEFEVRVSVVLLNLYFKAH